MNFEVYDKYAAAALQGMLASAPMFDRSKVNKEEWAKLAHEWAEAMMAERQKRIRKAAR